ncbi:MAG: SHOCT domain-containing protein [Chloroflexi bacterium]|nr:SHOCT domain-containing protein [Chloroflexota bacterium]
MTDKLRELKQLLDEELINEADYEQKKAELLRNL